MNDKNIVRLLRLNLQLGFRMLVKEYKEPLYWHIRRITVNSEDAQDATQETFIRVSRSLDQYDRDRPFKAWLYRIATNEALRIVGRRHPTVDVENDPEAMSMLADEYVDFTDIEAVNLQKAILSLPSIFIVPQCPSSGSWGAKMNEPLAKLIGEYEASCDEVYVLGGSMGVTGTWSLANAYPDKFSGIMPVAGKPGTADAANFKAMRVCTVMSESDEVMKTAYEDVKAFCEKIKAAGGNVSCTIVPASEQWNHQTTCEQSYTPERLRWLFRK